MPPDPEGVTSVVTTPDCGDGVGKFPGRAEDRWLPWLSATSAMIILSLVVVCGMPGAISFFLIPVLFLLILPALGLAGCVVIAVFFIKQLPRRAFSVVAALVTPIVLWRPIFWTSECLHTLVTVTTGAGHIGQYSLRGGGEVYDWSVGLAGGPSTFLIHDPTDTITRSTKPSDVENGTGQDLRDECAGRSQRLIGHYFTCTF